MKKIFGGVTAPLGFKANGIYCGVKASKKKDLALIYSEKPAVASGSFTTNKIQASCVRFDIRQLRSGAAQALIANAGNANCLTGASGMANTRRMAQAAAKALKIPSRRVLVGSTGVIGVPLPIQKILKSVPPLVKGLSRKRSLDAAQAILTTDRAVKEIAIETRIGNRRVRLGGIAKGAGMLHPHMIAGHQKHATMLCYITTDAAIHLAALRSAMARSIEKTFNMISVDADQSTNDMVIVMANGCAQNKVVKEGGKEFKVFSRALDAVCLYLAKMMVRDGEGATKFCEVSVKNAASREDARSVVLAVASSKLVKTALFGSDPNWGRIAASVGSSPAIVDPAKLVVKLGALVVLKNGTRTAQKASDLSRIFSRRNIRVSIDLGVGHHQATGWTCDLSTSYVRINSAYRT